MLGPLRVSSERRTELISSRRGRGSPSNEEPNWTSLGHTIIAVVQAAQSRAALNRALTHTRCGDGTSFRRVFLQPQMSAVVMIAADVIRRESLQMPFISHDHIIQQVVARQNAARARSSKNDLIC